MSDFYLFAHRGAKGYEPENTLCAFEKAIDLGAPWIELDVYLVEHDLVVIHDDRLERTTNGMGYVPAQTVSYLRSLDAGKGEKIPFLQEVVELVDGRAGLNIELKGVGTAAPVAGLLQAMFASSTWHADNILVSSFNHHELKAFAEILPEIRRGALTMSIPLDYAGFAEELGAWAVHASSEFVTPEFVDDTHRRGMKMITYTVNHPMDAVRLRKLGVDGVFTDFPDRIRL